MAADIAALGGDVPCFDGLPDTDQPKDTEVVIKEEDIAAEQPVGRKRRRGSDAITSITMSAHWLVLWSLSPYFRVKVR
jgi:hypothetical protein